MSRCWSASPTSPRARTPPCSTRSSTACGPSLLDRHADPDHHRVGLHARRSRHPRRRDGRRRAGPGRVRAARLHRPHGRPPPLRDARRRAVLRARRGPTRSPPRPPWRSPTGSPPTSGCRCSSTTTPIRCGARSPSCGPPRSSSARPTSARSGRIPTLGAVAVGARPPLIAVNCWLDTDDLLVAREIARHVREVDGGLAGVRALGLAMRSEGVAQVSMNLVDLPVNGPRDGVHRGPSARRARRLDRHPRRDRRPHPGRRARAVQRGVPASGPASTPDVTIEGRLAARG